MLVTLTREGKRRVSLLSHASPACWDTQACTTCLSVSNVKNDFSGEVRAGVVAVC